MWLVGVFVVAAIAVGCAGASHPGNQEFVDPIARQGPPSPAQPDADAENAPLAEKIPDSGPDSTATAIGHGSSR